MPANPAAWAYRRRVGARMMVPVPAAGGAVSAVGRQCSALHPHANRSPGSTSVVKSSATRSSAIRTMPPGARRGAHGGQGCGGIVHVVDGFEGADQVEGAGQLWVGRVGAVEGDPVGDAGCRGVLVGLGDGGLVEVDPGDFDQRVGLRDRDAGAS